METIQHAHSALPGTGYLASFMKTPGTGHCSAWKSQALDRHCHCQCLGKLGTGTGSASKCWALALAGTGTGGFSCFFCGSFHTVNTGLKYTKNPWPFPDPFYSSPHIRHNSPHNSAAPLAFPHNSPHNLAFPISLPEPRYISKLHLMSHLHN